jgi:hypothetical protein
LCHGVHGLADNNLAGEGPSRRRHLTINPEWAPEGQVSCLLQNGVRSSGRQSQRP